VEIAPLVMVMKKKQDNKKVMKMKKGIVMKVKKSIK